MITGDYDYKNLDVEKLYLPPFTGQEYMRKILTLQQNTKFRIYDIQHISKQGSEFVWIYYYGKFPEEKEYKPNAD